ncbi:hypothetical protein E4695_15125 [Alcaligenaceae bacterium 429]|nr:hypothetical protein E4695_15125 [Alcaligenaceae bacterium 429]
MSKVTMPEPVAYLRSDELRKLGDPNKIKGMSIHAVMDSARLSAKGTKELAERYGHGVAIITTDQAEAYKDACVREALEEAAKQPREYAMTLEKNGWGNRFPDELTAIFNAADNMADRIRALIPKQ